jgi:DNA-binding transcriptional ArsR family regulator
MKQLKNSKKIANFFSALSDETRLKILSSLIDGQKNVGEIHQYVGGDLTFSAISHQLKSLTTSDLIEYKKQGREKKYSLSGDFCWCILRDAVKHFNNTKLRTIKK